MTNMRGRDYLAMALLVIVVAFLTFFPGKGRGKNVPMDERHHAMYDAMKNGRTQAETELICTTCHSKSGLPLPKNHPPKEQCLICHLLA